jgi:hypothetical protein
MRSEMIPMNDRAYGSKGSAIVPNVADILADLPSLYLLIWIRYQQVQRQMRYLSGCQPAFVVFWSQDGWHTVMERFHHWIGVCGDDRVVCTTVSISPILASLAKSNRVFVSGGSLLRSSSVGARSNITV